MCAVFGETRKISLARELTKLHEEVIRTTLGEAVSHYENEPPRGEFVLIVEGAPEDAQPHITLEDAVVRARRLMEEGQPASYAAKTAAKESGLKKGDIYNAIK